MFIESLKTSQIKRQRKGKYIFKLWARLHMHLQRGLESWRERLYSSQGFGIELKDLLTNYYSKQNF